MMTLASRQRRQEVMFGLAFANRAAYHGQKAKFDALWAKIDEITDKIIDIEAKVP